MPELRPSLEDRLTDESSVLEEGERRGQKSDTAYRTISEVAEDMRLPQHVLRFWESKFKQISPLKRGGGRRFYRPQDIDLIKRIHYLLYTQGYTIKGVQKLLTKDRQLINSVPHLAVDQDDSIETTLHHQDIQRPVLQTLPPDVILPSKNDANPQTIQNNLLNDAGAQQEELRYLLTKIQELRARLPV